MIVIKNNLLIVRVKVRPQIILLCSSKSEICNKVLKLKKFHCFLIPSTLPSDLNTSLTLKIQSFLVERNNFLNTFVLNSTGNWVNSNIFYIKLKRFITERMRIFKHRSVKHCVRGINYKIVTPKCELNHLNFLGNDKNVINFIKPFFTIALIVVYTKVVW